MATKKGFWLALGAALATVAFFLIKVLPGFLSGRPVPEIDRSKKIDEDRKREESRIRQEIQRESDEQLAAHFNKLAGDKGKKEKV